MHRNSLYPASSGHSRFVGWQAIFWLLIIAVLPFSAFIPAQKVFAEDLPPSLPEHGDFGGDLDLLRSFYTPPQLAGESNYVIDMQVGEPLCGFVISHGLTNNHGLFVLSHAEALSTA